MFDFITKQLSPVRQSVNASGQHEFSLADNSPMVINENKVLTSEVDGYDDVDNLLALRIANKFASALVGDGFTVDFGNDKLNDEFEQFSAKLNLDAVMFEAVRQSLVMKQGALVYIVGGIATDPVNKVEKINIVDTKHVELGTVDSSKIFQIDNEHITVRARLVDGLSVIDPSRYGIINIFPNKKHSFIERILPYADIVQQLLERIKRAIDIETSVIYKSNRHNGGKEGKLADEEKNAFRDAMIRIRDNLGKGNIVLMPSADDMINFNSSSSIGDLIPALESMFAAVVGLPRSVIFGEERSGINTGAGKKEDRDNFMRDIVGHQNAHIRPVIEKIVDAFLNNRPFDYDVQFVKPQPLSDKEKTDINKIKNDTIIELIKLGVMTDEEGMANLEGILK